MKNKRDNRIGELRKNKQGLTMKIIRYINNKDVLIEFVETGERRKTTYYNFVKGTPTANLLKYPSRTECSFMQAVWISAGGLILLIGIIAAIAYSIIS